MRRSFRVEPRSLGVLLWVLFTPMRSVMMPSPAVGEELLSRYICSTLPEVLEDLRARGLEISYSEELVSPDLLVHAAIDGDASRSILDQALSEHGLVVVPAAGDGLRVVPDPTLDSQSIEQLRASVRNWQILRRQDTKVIPDWSDRTQIGRRWVDAVFPTESAFPVTEETDYLAIQLDESLQNETDERFRDSAFRLKDLIVEAAGRVTGLRVGLAGSRELLTRLTDEQLGPYIDGYVYRQMPFVPSADPTGRPWLRSASSEADALRALLAADGDAAELVLFEEAEIGRQHHDLLQAVRNSGSAYLAEQPQLLEGDQRSTHFFLNPEDGQYFLAVYADASEHQNLAFQISSKAAVRAVYPRDASFAHDVYGRTVRLLLDGSSRYYLFEVSRDASMDRRTKMLIEDEVIVDPYEVVVQNQIFQERERRKFRSLDVMEYISMTPHWRGGRQVQWEHRILKRKGKLDEYQHLSLWLDGVPFPEDKFRMNPLSRPAARVELEPLDIELKKTYRYSYLGQEEIDGHPTWRIGFEPRSEGRFLSGVVWIDQRTAAHRKMKTTHKSFGGGVLSREYTTYFGWIASNGSCHWDWPLRRGVEVWDYLGSSGTREFENRRERFVFNRPDIEQLIADSHASDLMIHVEAPPEGHRWLVKNENGKRIRGGVIYGKDKTPEDLGLAIGTLSVERETDLDLATVGQPQDRALSDLQSQLERRESFDGRVLAGLDAFATSSRVHFGVSGSSESSDVNEFFGFSFVDYDFIKTDWAFSVGGTDSDGLLAFTNPALAGSNWSLTTAFDFMTDPEQDFAFERLDRGVVGDESSFRDLTIDSQRATLALSLSKPLAGWSTARFTYSNSGLRFKRTAGTDPDFILPNDTDEHTFGLEWTVQKPRFSAIVRVEEGLREEWTPWGLAGSESDEYDFRRAELRLSTFKRFTRSQMGGLTLAYFRGWDTDRFSRQRLFQVDARVPGFSSSIGFDEATHLAASYNFRVWKLPFRFRLDYADMLLDERTDLHQKLTGAQLTLNLHGPFKTDIIFGIGHGLASTPDIGTGRTQQWLVFSRRFG